MGIKVHKKTTELIRNAESNKDKYKNLFTNILLQEQHKKQIGIELEKQLWGNVLTNYDFKQEL